MPGIFATQGTCAVDVGPAWASIPLVTVASSSTSNAVWQIWGGTTATGATDVWNMWNPITVASTASTIWHYWNAPIVNQPVRVTGGQRVSTLEEIAAQRQRETEARTRYETDAAQLKVDREEAKKKATILLEEHLTEAQRREFREKGHFYLYVGDKRYRIDRGWAGNVKLVGEKDEVLESLCIHPQDWVPEEDNMLAQKFLLESSEQDFRRIANITRHQQRAA